MPNVYNPSSPTAMGMEWFANFFATQDIVSVGAWAQSFRSRSAETINKLKLAFQTGSDTNIDILLGEIIPAGSEIPSGTVSTNVYQPNGDVTVTSWKTQAGGTTNLYQTIDEGVDTYDPTDYAKSTGLTASTYIVRFGTAGFSGTARVLKLQLAVAYIAPIGGSHADVYLRDRVGSVDYHVGPSPSMFYNSNAQVPTVVVFDLGEINPKTKLPWTPTDIQGFDSAGALWAVKFLTSASSSIEFRILACELRVVTQSVENRVAACTWSKASAALSGGVDSGAFVALPGAGATWAKPASGDFTLLVRKPTAPLVTVGAGTRFTLWYSGRTLAGVEQPNVVPGAVSAVPTLDSYGQATACDFTKTTGGRTIDVDIKTSAPADSNDSLPYVEATATVTATNKARQQITPGATTTFPIIRFNATPGNATNPLLIKIKRNSDNVQFGSTYTMLPAECTAFPAAGSYYEIQIVLTTPPSLVSGTKYYVEFTTADTSTSGWQIPYVTSSYTGGDGAGFNGTTDTGDVNGSGFANATDIPVVIAQKPTTPTNFAATTTTLQPANYAVANSGCNIPLVNLTRVTWTKTSLGANFGYYEIQRSEDHAVTWVSVKTISTEATQAWTDQEAPKGLNVQYRIRTIRSLDGFASDWSAASAGVTAQAVGCEVVFCSNEQSSLLVAYNREPEVKFSFLAATRDLLVGIFGSDNVVAFMESEDAGVSFQMVLTVNFKDAPIDDTIGIFAPLRTIARATSSYICVLDWTGNRWFAHVQVTDGDWTEPEHGYHATVTVTTVSNIPSVAAE